MVTGDVDEVMGREDLIQGVEALLEGNCSYTNSDAGGAYQEVPMISSLLIVPISHSQAEALNVKALSSSKKTGSDIVPAENHTGHLLLYQ